MSTVHKHSIVQVFVIISSLAIIIADLNSGEVAKKWDNAAFILIAAELIIWQLIRKRLPKDPFVRFHKALDVVCVISICTALAIKLFKLISFKGDTIIPPLIGYVCLACILTIVGWIIFKIKKLDK